MKIQSKNIHINSCPVTDCANEAFTHPMYGVLPCSYHQELRSHNELPDRQVEFTSVAIKDGRKSHARSVLQPWRQHTPSKEFIEAWPEDAKKIFTDKERKKAKNVWSDVASYRNWRTSK